MGADPYGFERLPIRCRRRILNVFAVVGAVSLRLRLPRQPVKKRFKSNVGGGSKPPPYGLKMPFTSQINPNLSLSPIKYSAHRKFGVVTELIVNLGCVLGENDTGDNGGYL